MVWGGAVAGIGLVAFATIIFGWSCGDVTIEAKSTGVRRCRSAALFTSIHPGFCYLALRVRSACFGTGIGNA